MERGLFVSIQYSAHSQFMDGDIGAIESSQLRRQIAYVAWCHTSRIGDTWDFDAGAMRQIGDQPVVEHIATEGIRLPGQYRLHDV